MSRVLRSFATAALLTGATLSVAPSASAQIPASDIATKMVGVVDELGRKDTGRPVQDEQKTILADLDELIASLEKKCEECRGNLKRNNPNRGMDDSRITRGTGGSGPLVNAGDEGKDWGKLSPRERDRILQSMSEGFPPEYRTVLERYYKRLAEEKKATPAVPDRNEPKDAEPKR